MTEWNRRGSAAARQSIITGVKRSLIVVASALVIRSSTIPFAAVVSHWPIIANLLAGSLLPLADTFEQGAGLLVVYQAAFCNTGFHTGRLTGRCHGILG